MNSSADGTILESLLDGFVARTDGTIRALALYAAAVAVCRASVLDRAVACAVRHQVSGLQLYEIVLQSYLFLGFPRMLEAAQHLNQTLPPSSRKACTHAVTPQESETWFHRGMTLYRRVYGSNHQLLKERVELFAPEIFRWMIVEGYGKVLSRPGLDSTVRELAVVAMIMMENRERQLHSHLKGALNVGATPELVRQVVEDIGPAAGEGHQTAQRLLDNILNEPSR
jgi:4-carboxymuconolactone decarboxylase